MLPFNPTTLPVDLYRPRSGINYSTVACEVNPVASLVLAGNEGEDSAVGRVLQRVVVPPVAPLLLLQTIEAGIQLAPAANTKMKKQAAGAEIRVPQCLRLLPVLAFDV